MNKMLFTDGTNGLREVVSPEELETLIASAAEKEKIRIWLFNSNEWISLAAYYKQFPGALKITQPVPPGNTPAIAEKHNNAKFAGWLKKAFYMTGIAVTGLLVFNFTRIKWKEAEPLTIMAARPANVPSMDMDSLIAEIEMTRGQVIDKNTKTNLRMRNTWPERILLQLNSDRETSSTGSRFSGIAVTVDNTTGFTIDKAIVKLSAWKNNKLVATDTLAFSSIKYDKPVKRELDNIYKADSLSVSFENIKAKSFNFCYSAAIKNNSGNYNDRWFCRE